MNDRPNGNMTEAELIALHANPARHPKALGYELTCCKAGVLAALVRQAPAELAAMGAAEIERRRAAVARLLADNPTLRAMVG